MHPLSCVEKRRLVRRSIKLTCILCLGLSTGNCFALDDVPKRPAFDRYASMMNKSPFAVATAMVNAEKPNFAKDLYLANAAKLTDSDMITVQSAVDRNMKEYLTTKGPNEHGFAIISIDWSERPAETKATISKDGVVATIGFNQALMSQVPQPIQPPGPSAPGQPTMPSYIPPRANMPAGVPTPVPRVRPPIQRLPGQAARPNSDPSQ